MKRRIGHPWRVAGLLLMAAAALVLLFPRSPSSPSSKESVVAAAIDAKPPPGSPPEVAAAPPGADPAVAQSQHPVSVQKLGWPPIKEYSSVSTALEALRPAAEAGDVESMLAIARNLEFCRDGVSDPDNQKWLHQHAAQLGEVLAGDYDQYIVALTKHCDLPATQIQAEYRHWVLQAADSGQSQAQLYAALHPPVPDLVSAEREILANGQDLQEAIFGSGAQALSLHYARLARDQGEMLAARLLINAPAEDGVSPGDPVEGYENRLLLSRIDASRGHPWSDSSLGGPAARLRPVEREQAEQQVQVWLDTVPSWIARPNLTPEVSEMANAAAEKARVADSDSAH